MHHCSRYLTLLLTLILAGGGFSGCSNDDTENDNPSKPTFEATLGTVGPNLATLNLKTTGITECAWVCYPAAEAQQLEPAAIFATGTTVACKDGDNSFDISDLEPVSEYIVYLAAKTSGAFYDGKIAPISFTTTGFTDEISIVKRTLDGFVAHINLPEEVIERGNAIKWQVGNLLMYNMLKERMPDAAMLESNDEYYGRYFRESTTLTIDEEHRVKLDENGDPVDKWVFIAPGEPLVFLLGEHEYGESMFGWGEGWYTAMFDFDAYYEAMGGGGGFGPMLAETSTRNDIDQSEFWSGYYKKIEVRAAEPAVLDGKVEFSTSNLRPNGGTLHFTPSDNVMQYCVCILDHASYEGQILPLLDNNESYLQWFASSFDAMLQFGAQSLSGAQEVNLDEVFYTLTPGIPYHVLITGMGDEAGSAQCFAHKTFELPEASLPAPEIVVTAIPNPDGKESPYEAWFNVKSPSKDVATGGYACNYLRDFILAINDGATYADLISQSRAVFSTEEIAQINSDAGYNMMFTSREDARTRLAVMAWNIEGTGNNPDEQNSPAIADQKTISLPAADRVESPLFTDLLGDWTATASVMHHKYNDETFNYEWVNVSEPQKSKVSLVSGATYPAVLPSEVYALYPNMTKAEVDALYQEFKNCADAFNQKVRGQNRILCQGFNFDIDGNAENGRPLLSFKTPYELFIDDKYGTAVTVDDLFYDFGPKWYLQIAADGKVFVPVNMNRMNPMSVWADGNEYHLAPADTEGVLYVPAEEDMDNVEKWPNIPVEVSADKRTITLKKVEYTNPDNTKLDLYPSVVYSEYGNLSLFPTKISSEIVLTKGWTEPSAKSTKVSGKIAPSLNKFVGEPLKALNGASVLKPQQRPNARTPISTVAPVKYKSAENFQILTPEQIKANIIKYTDQMTQRVARK